MYDNNRINKLKEANKYSEIVNYLTKWKNTVASQAKKIEDPNNKKEIKDKQKAARRLINGVNATIIKCQSEKMMIDEMKKGLDRKTASKIVRKKIKDYKNALKADNKLDSASEAALDIVENWLIAEEEMSTISEVGENTVGSSNSRANFDTNYSNSSKNKEGDISRDGSEGSKESVASHEDNFGGDELDESDPILTGDGSVGQKNSTAKDPAHESYDNMDDDDIDEAMEAYFESLDEMMENKIAEESIFGADFDQRHIIKTGPQAKKAKSLMKQGKRATRSKDYKTAINLYTEAKNIYKSLLNTANKMRSETVNADTYGSFNGNSGSGYINSTGKTITRNTGQKNHVINWCQQKIVACDNAITKIKNKIASESFIDDEWGPDDMTGDSAIESLIFELNNEIDN